MDKKESPEKTVTLTSTGRRVASQDRVIRVFISSTFRDMQEEREFLVKFVFPQLRRLCEARDVTWGEVDLRWGVTDEAAAEGKILPICFEEIDRCRPYFIGLLGERYGWVPQTIPEGLIKKEEWLDEQLRSQKSVTELEILHGVLRNPAMADHAYFYFRDPDYVNSIPERDRKDFVSENAERQAKLSELKGLIRRSGLPVHENYSGPKELGDLILADLTKAIDSLYPEGSAPDLLDREAAEHNAYAQSRFGVYIGREEYFIRLDAHVQGNGPPLVVVGASGSGKSALLANWTERHRNKDRTAQKEDLFFIHFIGATPASADWAAMTRRILGEFKRRLAVELELPNQPEALRATFASALQLAASRGRIIMILDALNQLEDRDQARDLLWLPPSIPENVRLILSTLPGRPLEELSKRGWPTLEVEPLGIEEQKRLIVEFLAQHAKKLSSERVERIAAAPQSANPLFLRALLEELRLWGNHFTLDRAINHYLSARDPDDLYTKILARYEEDYERERPALVKETMTFLWAARRGLAETELLDLLGNDGAPLPAAHWSPLYLAAEKALVNRSGLIGFFHNYLRQAVKQRYLPEEHDQAAAHLLLAEYFAKQEACARKADELPWQLHGAKQWQSLAATLSDLELFELAFDQNRRYEWMEYWRFLEGLFHPGRCYQEAIEAKRNADGKPPFRLMYKVGWFLRTMGLDSCAEDFLQKLKATEHGIEPVTMVHALINQALICRNLGKYEDAFGLIHEALEIGVRAYSLKHPNIAQILNIMAELHIYRGQLDEALLVYESALSILEEYSPQHPEVAATLCGLAEIHREAGRYAEALSLLKRAVEIDECALGPNDPKVAKSLSCLAALQVAQGNLAEAMQLYRRAFKIIEQTLGANHPELAKLLEDMARLNKRTGYDDQARKLNEQARRLRSIKGVQKG